MNDPRKPQKRATMTVDCDSHEQRTVYYFRDDDEEILTRLLGLRVGEQPQP